MLVGAARESGTAVLLVSHDEALIEAVCDTRVRLGEALSAGSTGDSHAGYLPAQLMHKLNAK